MEGAAGDRRMARRSRGIGVRTDRNNQAVEQSNVTIHAALEQSRERGVAGEHPLGVVVVVARGDDDHQQAPSLHA